MALTFNVVAGSEFDKRHELLVLTAARSRPFSQTLNDLLATSQMLSTSNWAVEQREINQETAVNAFGFDDLVWSFKPTFIIQEAA